MRVVRVDLDVRNLFDGPVENRPGRGASAPGRHRIGVARCLHPSGRKPVVGHEMQKRAVKLIDLAELRFAEARRALCDRLENRLRIRRRLADDAQDLARRRLLLECLGDVAIACLQFREQANVLDCDDRLIGEGRHELDLLVAEGVDPHLPQHDDAEQRIALQHGHGQQRAVSRQLLDLAALIAGLGQDVVPVDRPALLAGDSGYRTGTEGNRMIAQIVEHFRPRAVSRRKTQQLAVEPVDVAMLGAAQSRRAGDHRVEHRLQSQTPTG